MSHKFDDGPPAEIYPEKLQMGREKITVSRFCYIVACILLGLHLVHYTTSSRLSRRFGLSSYGDDAIGIVKWFTCDGTVVPGMDCGSVVVPLDHFNYTKGTSTIALARYKATGSPKRGTIFLNPGGPGGSGVQFALGAGPMMSQMLGPYYDLVGFDPRGIGKTVPKTQCFSNPIHQQYLESNTVLEQGFSAASNLTDSRTRAHLIEQSRQFLVLKKIEADLCAENMGEELAYMGTQTVVRDIDFMTTVMDGEDALINFFGASYGTIIGAYLVNMFPDRVGKVAIDGVVDPIMWTTKQTQYWTGGSLSSTEDTFQIFLRDCSESGPEICPLSRFKNEDPKKIETRIEDFFDELYENPLAVPDARRPGYLTAGGARALLLIYLTSPTAWPRASKDFADAMAGDGKGILNKLLPQYLSYPLPDKSAIADLSRQAVSCLDAPRPATEAEFPTPEELADVGLNDIRNLSRHFGMSMSVSEPDGGCEYWPVEELKRFEGPWNHTLKNPILIVSNTADPVTPISSGRLVNSLLGNSSRLLVQDSPGHCSLGLASLCTLNAYRAFFINGTLPPNEFVCQVNQSPFPKAETGLNIDSTSLSEEDAQLLAAASEVGRWMAKQRLPYIYF